MKKFEEINTSEIAYISIVDWMGVEIETAETMEMALDKKTKLVEQWHKERPEISIEQFEEDLYIYTYDKNDNLLDLAY